MATLPLVDCIDREIVGKLKSGLPSLAEEINSVHYLDTDQALHVWVGLSKDDRAARYAVYDFEDEISKRYSNVVFDFHVIPVPEGRSIEEYISAADRLFQRNT